MPFEHIVNRITFNPRVFLSLRVLLQGRDRGEGVSHEVCGVNQIEGVAYIRPNWIDQ